MAKGLEVFIYGLVLVTLLLLLYKSATSRRLPLYRPFLSLLLLVKDQENLIEDMVRRIAGLHRKARFAFDLVIVDKGSRDQTPALLQCLAGRYSLAVVNLAGDDSPSPVEAGAPFCRGDLICIVDLEGRLEPELVIPALESLLGIPGPRDCCL